MYLYTTGVLGLKLAAKRIMFKRKHEGTTLINVVEERSSTFYKMVWRGIKNRKRL